jgi:hypothetical protein
MITVLYENISVGRASVQWGGRPARQPIWRPETVAPPTAAFFIFHCVREEIIVGMSSQVSLIIGKGKAGIY